MKNNNKYLLLLSLFINTSLYSQITTNQGISCVQAVDELTGIGVNISNVTCNCSANAIGNFDNATNLPVSSGVILSTGDIDQITSGQCSGSTTVSNNNGSTGELNGIAGNNTFDQCTIEFDITPTCNSLQISFFYGSDEYPEFVNSSYNDAFAFYITGPGITGTQNLAVVPGTTSPVTINTINSGTNSNFYNSNGSCGNGIEFDGYTNELTTFADVQQCQQYHMKITIADAGDAAFDSGVFLLKNGLKCPNGGMNVAINKTDNICSSECNGTIDLNISGGAPPYSINWINYNSTSSSLSNLCNGKYFVEVTDNTCNSYMDSIEITSLQVLDAIINFDTVCFGDVTTFTEAHTLSSGAISSREWDFGDNTFSSLENPTHLYPSEGSYNVTLIIISDNGCRDTISEVIIVNSKPIALFTVDSLCLGNPSTITNNSSITAPDNIISYTWNFGDGNNSNDQNPTHIYTNEGTYTVDLTLESNNGCISNLTETTIIYPNPIADFNVNDDCINVAAQFTDNSSIASGTITNWEWDFDDLSPFDNSEDPSHIYATDGTYQPTLTVTSSFGCSGNVTKSTTRHPIPMLGFTANPECLNDPINFINNTTINAPSSITNWIWNFGDNTPFSVDENPQHQYTNDGVYNVTLIASSNFGCVGDISIPVQVYPIPTPDFSASNVCVNNPPMNFLDLSSVSNGTIINWQWNFDNGNLSTLQIPNNYYNQAGIYDVELTVTSNNNCTNSVNIPVVVYPKPTADFSVDIFEGCSPVCVNFSDNSTHNATDINEWQWNLGNGEGSSISSPTTCYVNPSNTDDVIYNTSLIIKNDLGCYDTIMQDNLITSWHNPIADFNPDPEEVNMYEAEINMINNSIGADNYSWDFNNSSSSNDFEPSTNYSDTGSFIIQLIVTTINNCADTIIKPVKITPVASLFIPNSFTPNSDGNNDGFIFKEFGIDIPTSKFSIFDRWGTLIYYTENATPWDGTYKGEAVMQDTYIYRLICKDVLGVEHKQEGHVLLLR